MGFKNSSVHPGVFVKDNGNERKNIYAALFVNDAFVACGDINVMNEFKSYLFKQFSMRDLGDTRYALGTRITRDSSIISLDQTTYINNLLQTFNMYNCNAIKIPLSEKFDFINSNSDITCNAPSQSLLGSLMYLVVCTRPDLSFAVNVSNSRFVGKKNETDWKYLKSILRYLNRASDLK